MSKVKIATIWMDGCSGCHMSFLDIDERLLDLADHIELVYSPLVDNKVYPDHVDVALIEGAVANEEDLAKIKKVREHTSILVALGDCAVTSNVSAMRNQLGVDAVLKHGYVELATLNQGPPTSVVPKLLPRVRPVHEVVKVDVFVPGCPPSADAIFTAVSELLAGRIPEVAGLTRFGA